MVTTTLPLGGAETLQLRVLSGLSRPEFHAEVLCLREAGQMAPRFESAGVPVSVLGRRRAQHVVTIPKIASWLRARRVDVMLVTPHHAALYLAPAAARIAGVRGTALGLHMIGGRAIGIPSLPPGGVELMFLIDALVLLTDAQRRYLEEHEGLNRFPWRRVRHAIIPNGVEVGPPPGADDVARARAALGLDHDDLVVGCVAALRREKDHELLLGAVGRLAPAHPRLRLALIGSGEREQALRERARELGIADRTLFLGYRSDVAGLLPGLDVKCLTSVQETFPVSVLEAMAAGVPVVMTDCEGAPALVEDGVSGYLVPVGDVDELTRRLAALLSDPALRVRMGGAGRRAALEGHSLTRTVERYEALLRALAGVEPAAGRTRTA
jgi:glycosyltransferase involved in cell wall biosynthesis